MERQQQENQNAEQQQDGQQGNAEQQHNQQGEPFRVFSSQDELDKFMADRAKRAERKALNTQARTLGYDDWHEMQEALQAIRKTPAQDAQQSDSQQSSQKQDADRGSVDEAAKLRMALTVAGELNLPAALIGRLQGDTVEAMKADAEQLLGLFAQAPAARAVGAIPRVPNGNQPVTFTRAQLQDAAFVRAHKDEIMRAANEGRIVDS